MTERKAISPNGWQEWAICEAIEADGDVHQYEFEPFWVENTWFVKSGASMRTCNTKTTIPKINKRFEP